MAFDTSNGNGLFTTPVRIAHYFGAKVKGLILAKAGGFLFLAPLAILFIPGGWQLVSGVMPTYWITRNLVAIYRPELGYGISLAIGPAYHGGLLWLLLRLFSRRNRMGRLGAVQGDYRGPDPKNSSSSMAHRT